MVVCGDTVAVLGEGTPPVPFGVFKYTALALATKPQLNKDDCPFTMELGFAVKPLNIGVPLHPPFTRTVVDMDALLLPQ